MGKCVCRSESSLDVSGDTLMRSNTVSCQQLALVRVFMFRCISDCIYRSEFKLLPVFRQLVLVDKCWLSQFTKLISQ